MREPARAAARAQATALILLDMQLPDMDGHEVLRRLRADPATADIRCIALSANAMPDDIRRALENGFDDYWTKPLDLRAFMRALDRLLGVARVEGAAQAMPGNPHPSPLTPHPSPRPQQPALRLLPTPPPHRPSPKSTGAAAPAIRPC